MYYIYQRISTEKQSLIRQEGAIADYCKANNIEVAQENVYSDIITGKTIKRENYQKMKAKIDKGDFLILLDLDRLGRNWDIIKDEWKELTDKGVNIIVINCPLLNVMPDNNGQVSIDKRLIQSIMFELLCYLSQKEVEKISQRTKEALRVKRETDPNFKIGKPKTITAEQEQQVIELHEQGNKIQEIADIVGVSVASVHRIVRKAKGELKNEN